MENNIIKNISSFGYDNYFLNEKGQLFKGAASVLKEVKKDSKNRYYLIDNCGNGQRITVKKLYKKVFKKEFSIDEIESFNNEEWKPIADTEYKYFVSNYGRIKSYCGNNAIVLKPYLNSEGYYEVKIKGKNAKIHQLVAYAFCENKYKDTNTKTEIHHINEVKTDNRSENLLIVSIAEHHKIHSKKGSK